MNYSVYKPPVNWWILQIMKALALSGIVSLLFFDTLWILPILSGLSLLFVGKTKDRYIAKVKSCVREEFKEFITILSGSINAGYSLEKAFIKTYEDIEKTKRDFPYLLSEIRRIINGIGINKSIEEMLIEMGERLDIEEIQDFSSLITTAKMYGGDINRLINQTRKSLNDKFLVETEIGTMISAKQMEGLIMVAMPFFIIGYMRITNGTYMDYMYDTGIGRIAMTISLLVVVGMAMVIEKTVRIEV